MIVLRQVSRSLILTHYSGSNYWLPSYLELICFGLFSIIAIRFNFTSKRFKNSFDERLSNTNEKYCTVDGGAYKLKKNWRAILRITNIVRNSSLCPALYVRCCHYARGCSCLVPASGSLNVEETYANFLIVFRSYSGEQTLSCVSECAKICWRDADIDSFRLSNGGIFSWRDRIYEDTWMADICFWRFGDIPCCGALHPLASIKVPALSWLSYPQCRPLKGGEERDLLSTGTCPKPHFRSG